MKSKAKIKVIKKGTLKVPKKSVNVVNNTKKVAAREMVSTVTNWVSDFQQRKRDETKQAIEKFFSQQPQTSGV